MRRSFPKIAPAFQLREILSLCAMLVIVGSSTALADDVAFEETVRPILEERCYTCHSQEMKKGGVNLEGAAQRDKDLWWAVLKNLRSGIMPPAEKPQPTSEERGRIEEWIKAKAFGIDPKDPDPGRVTVRRLNRVEYRNTIRDLLGVDFDANLEFPPDDSGHGFDNIGDVLTMSPLLLEKYLGAAKSIIGRSVPTVAKTMAERTIVGQRFHRTDKKGGEGNGPPSLSYYEPATIAHTFKAEHDGHYRLTLNISANERYVDNVFDKNRCRFLFKIDGEELLNKEFGREEGKAFHFDFDRDWKEGSHELTIEVEPLTPGEKQVRSLAIRIQSVVIQGPKEEKYWVRPRDYEKFFPGAVPDEPAARRQYTRELLGKFAAKAFRRPIDESTKDRLATLAESVATQKGQTYEAGVAQAMTAVLTSPRFLFREEAIDPLSSERYPLIDEYSLASRLSYFLWSSMPDDELIELASRHKLRENLDKQVNRMLADSRSREFFRHFIGQWLQARDIESVIINAAAVISRDEKPDPEAERRRARFRELVRKPTEELTEAEQKELKEARASFPRSFGRFRQFELTGELRQAMRRESEMLFEHLIKDNRSLLELLDSDYTFLNERLAKYYGIDGVQGDLMRKVELAKESPRGGILTQGTILAVTSNPDRTSPVKRGLFILDNILGSPPAPPPPNIPSLEEAGKKAGVKTPTVREQMVLHRTQPSCAGCHARMDPLGLALENFNALGRFRENERTSPVNASGKLITGEPFKDVMELKKILVEKHRREFYHCLTEKLLTYALGRGLEAYDVQAIDSIVGQIESKEGHSSALIAGIIESAPFQKRRRSTTIQSADNSERKAVPTK